MLKLILTKGLDARHSTEVFAEGFFHGRSFKVKQENSYGI